MKRVFLTADPTDLSQRDPLLVRRATVALLRYAVDADGAGHRDVGDPVHETITEGRYKQWLDARARGEAWAMKMEYSSCGDLIHWLLTMLGCRDETLVNRTADGGTHPWIPGKNITMLQGHPCTKKPSDGGEPDDGDAVFVMNRFGGHVFGIIEWPGPPDVEDGSLASAVSNAIPLVTSADYGTPCGKLRVKKIERGAQLVIEGNPVLWWLDITMVSLTESCVVPDSFDGAVLDDNPYEEPGVTIPDTLRPTS